MLFPFHDQSSVSWYKDPVSGQKPENTSATLKVDKEALEELKARVGWQGEGHRGAGKGEKHGGAGRVGSCL